MENRLQTMENNMAKMNEETRKIAEQVNERMFRAQIQEIRKQLQTHAVVAPVIIEERKMAHDECPAIRVVAELRKEIADLRTMVENNKCQCKLVEVLQTGKPMVEPTVVTSDEKDNEEKLKSDILLELAALVEQAQKDDSLMWVDLVKQHRVLKLAVNMYPESTMLQVYEQVHKCVGVDVVDNVKVANYLATCSFVSSPDCVIWASIFISMFARKYASPIEQAQVHSLVDAFERKTHAVELPASPRAAVQIK